MKNTLHDEYIYGSCKPNKAELDHFLTRLLYESAPETQKKDTVALSGNLEAGLFILACEVMAKNEQNEENAKK